jgi:hypothetical protein
MDIGFWQPKDVFAAGDAPEMRVSAHTPVGLVDLLCKIPRE